MCRLLRYIAGGAALFLVGAYTAAIGSEVSHFGFSNVVESAVVDRAHKSDKLPVAQASTRQSPAMVQTAPVAVKTIQVPRVSPTNGQPPKILEGCDPAVSPLTVAAEAAVNFTGRCLAALSSPVRVADARP